MEATPLTFSPEDVGLQLGTSGWWIREQARRGRIPHLRLAKGRVRFLPEHVESIVSAFTVTPRIDEIDVGNDYESFGATERSASMHRSNRPALGA